LPKNKELEDKEKNFKIKIVQNAVPSTIAALSPFAVREFHGLKFFAKAVSMVVIFCGVDLFLMRPHFLDYKS